jgi:uncharacterized protein
MNVRRLVPALLTALLLAACSGGSDTAVDAGTPTVPAAAADSASPSSEDVGRDDTADAVDDPTVTLVSPEGPEVTFDVELAADPPTRQLGLMGRTELADDAGMLFLFPDDRDGGFWMKDTLIPLQIAYLDADGVVLAILDMTPCTEDPCPSYNPGMPYRYALEVNVGAFDARGVTAGWRAELPAGLPDAS